MINQKTDAKRKKKGDNTFFSNVSKRKRKTMSIRSKIVNWLNTWVIEDPRDPRSDF